MAFAAPEAQAALAELPHAIADGRAAGNASSYMESRKSSFEHVNKMKLEEDRYAGLLRACGNTKNLSKGRRIHELILHSEQKRNTYLGNLLVQMYGKCGSLEDARAVFENISHRNPFSWNIIIAAYIQNGHLQEARCMFDEMPIKNAVSWTTMVAAYAQKGHLLEARILFDRMPRRTVPSCNAMITGYALNGNLHEARSMFDKMPDRDVVSWNAMITAYAQSGRPEEARNMFDRMPSRDVVSWTAMVTAYAQSGHLREARSLFEKMPDKNLVSWTCIIAGYAETGQETEAIALFKLMDLDGIQPDQMTYVTVLDACANIGALAEGKAIHADVLHSGFSSDIVVATAIITMYGKCGRLTDARDMFNRMPRRTVVSWSAMIAAYAQNGHGNEAIHVFQVMDLEGTHASEITFVSILDACATVSALAYGKLLHACASDNGFELDEVVGTALINMYGKCGSLVIAREVFDRMPRKDVVSWTAMVTVYAQNGHGTEAAELYQQMHIEGVKPNEVTLVSVLSVCSHSGMLEDGLKCFHSLHDYGIRPRLDHYVCMIDLLGRAGQLKEAEELMNQIPFQPPAVAWMALLSSCRDFGDAERGERVARELLHLKSGNASPYMLLTSCIQGQ